MSKPNEPRYWIVEQTTDHPESLEWTPILEGSAFAQVLKERDELKCEYENVCKFATQYEQERDNLQVDNRKLRAALESIRSKHDGHECADIARKALEQT